MVSLLPPEQHKPASFLRHGNTRSNAMTTFTPPLRQGQQLRDPDLKDYNLSKKVNNLIKRLDRTCQAQAFHIKNLENDKRNLFFKGGKANRDLKELKTLLSRAEVKDQEVEGIDFAMPCKDASRIFKMLDETDEEDSEEDDDDDDDDEMDKVVQAPTQVQGTKLNDSRSRIAGEKNVRARRNRKRGRRTAERKNAARRESGEADMDIDGDAMGRPSLRRALAAMELR